MDIFYALSTVVQYVRCIDALLELAFLKMPMHLFGVIYVSQLKWRGHKQNNRKIFFTLSE